MPTVFEVKGPAWLDTDAAWCDSCGHVPSFDAGFGIDDSGKYAGGWYDDMISCFGGARYDWWLDDTYDGEDTAEHFREFLTEADTDEAKELLGKLKLMMRIGGEMTDLKPGDRVLLTGKDWDDCVDADERVGVIRPYEEWVRPYNESELSPTVDVGDGECWCIYQFGPEGPGGAEDYSVKKIDDGSGESGESGGPCVPYYQFPGGVEVRQISAHLTSFAGQALQYLARSSRLDGNNKGDTLGDLKKARDLINWEIERLGNE